MCTNKHWLLLLLLGEVLLAQLTTQCTPVPLLTGVDIRALFQLMQTSMPHLIGQLNFSPSAINTHASSLRQRVQAYCTVTTCPVHEADRRTLAREQWDIIGIGKREEHAT